MSTETIESGTNVNGHEGQAGGSPPPESHGDDGRAEEGSKGQDGSGEQGGGQPDLVAQNKELRQALTQQGEEIANLRELADLINENQDLQQEVLRRAEGRGREEDDLAELDRMADDAFDPKSAAGLKKLLRSAVSIGERRAEQRVKPYLGQIQRTAAGTEFVRGLRQAGLDAELVDDPEFQAHLREMRGAYRSFAATERADPIAAADFAATKWKSKRGQVRDFQREKQRIDDARASSLNSRGSNPSMTRDGNTVDLPRLGGARAIYDALKRGVKPEQIRRK